MKKFTKTTLFDLILFNLGVIGPHIFSQLYHWLAKFSPLQFGMVCTIFVGIVCYYIKNHFK